jgi:NUMOD3 motif
MKPTYLYVKQHAITGLKYFGKTNSKDPYKYLGSGKYWTSHLKAHGKEHVITVLLLGPYTDKEKIMNDALYFSNAMNITESNEWANLKPENGIDGGGMVGLKLSQEAKDKVSAAQKGRKRTPEQLEQHRKRMKGKKHTPATKAKMSTASKGKKKSASAIANMRKARTGMKHTAEAKAKMSAAKKGKVGPSKGKPMSAETKAKISNAKKGTKASPETKAKLSAIRKGKPSPTKGMTMSAETKAKISATKEGKKKQRSSTSITVDV